MLKVLPFSLFKQKKLKYEVMDCPAQVHGKPETKANPVSKKTNIPLQPLCTGN